MNDRTQAPARNPWQEAVDEARVTAHLGIAADGVTREQAIAQLGELIDWNIAVATDPAVNGGFKLAPVAQSPAGRVTDDAVREYVNARNAYEDATRPPNSHAQAPRIPHDSPVLLRYRNARAALEAALGQGKAS